MLLAPLLCYGPPASGVATYSSHGALKTATVMGVWWVCFVEQQRCAPRFHAVNASMQFCLQLHNGWGMAAVARLYLG
jgi:hypothetical protein